MFVLANQSCTSAQRWKRQVSGQQVLVRTACRTSKVPGTHLRDNEPLAAVVVVACHVQADLEEVLVDLGVQVRRHQHAVLRVHRVLHSHSQGY